MLFILAVLFALSAKVQAQSSTCSQGFESISNRKSATDSEYRKIAKLPEELKGPQITRMLNEVLSPLTDTYSAAFEKISDAKIRKIFYDLNNKYPIRTLADLNKEKGWFPGEYSQYERDYKSFRESFQLGEETVSQHPDVFEKSVGMLWTPADVNGARVKGTIYKLLSMNMTNVGHYGPGFSESALRTSQIMTQIAEDSLADQSQKIFNGVPSLLMNETARGSRMSVLTKAEHGTQMLNAFIEGISSLNQLVTNSLGHEVPGAATGKDALHALFFEGKTKGGLVSEITARMPLGLNGPLALSRHHFKKPFVRLADGKLDLDAGLSDYLKSTKKDRSKRVCPFAVVFQSKHKEGLDSLSNERKSTDLQRLAEIYWRVFNQVESARLASPNQTGLRGQSSKADRLSQ